MDVDCVIATHRRPELLSRALRSVLGQSELPNTVIVADDVDDPDTRAVVEDAQRSSHLAVRHVACVPADGDGTAGRTRNAGAAAASGRYIAFLDDDDEWQPSYLKSAVELLAAGSELVLSPTTHARGDWRGVGIDPLKVWTTRAVLQKNPGLTGSNFLISRNRFSALGGFDPSLRVANDWDFAIRAFDSGVRPAVLEVPLVVQHAHDEGQLTARTERRAAGLEAFGDRYRGRMTWSQRRELSRVVHSIRRVSSPTAPERAYHFVMQVLTDSPGRVTRAALRRIGGMPTVYR